MPKAMPACSAWPYLQQPRRSIFVQQEVQPVHLEGISQWEESHGGCGAAAGRGEHCA